MKKLKEKITSFFDGSNRTRIILVSIISIILVLTLFISGTYSLFIGSNVDENLNVYQTGVLDITYTLSQDNIIMESAVPTSLEESKYVKPYTMRVKNTGNVAYKFDVIIADTTASNKINYEYLMVQVGKLDPIKLSDCETVSLPSTDCTNCQGLVIKSDVIIPAGEDAVIDVRVWVSDSVSNSEIGNVFYAKLKLDGLAVYNEDDDIDNSVLRAYTYLADAEPGSYVAYVGDNGCTGDACKGYNANYVDDTSMGYCNGSGYKFTVSGWRLAYSKDGIPYIISAGSPECMCTNSSGIALNNSCSSSLAAANLSKHAKNLDNVALKYCNDQFSYNTFCDVTTARNINATDFEIMTKGSTLSSCSATKSEACGFGNNLIDVGSFYWFSDPISSSTTYTFSWRANTYYYVYRFTSDYLFGVRPVLKLAPTVEITGGTGTYEDPYQIRNEQVDYVYLTDVAETGDYVKYNGDNGCLVGHCDGDNANYIDDTDMGYCSTSDNKFTTNGWRVGYRENDIVHIISAGSPECICTNSDGTASSSSCDTSEATSGVPLHINNLNEMALGYCDGDYVYGNVCNNSAVWAASNSDYNKMIGSNLSSCLSLSNEECGSANDLVSNGGFYWYATGTSTTGFNWSPSLLGVSSATTDNLYGVRPVLKMNDGVRVTGGDGSYENPYKLKASTNNYAYDGALYYIKGKEILDKTVGGTALTATSNGYKWLATSWVDYDKDPDENVSVTKTTKFMTPIELNGHNAIYVKYNKSSHASEDYVRIHLSSTDAHNGDLGILTESELTNNTTGNVYLGVFTTAPKVYIKVTVHAGFTSSGNKGTCSLELLDLHFFKVSNDENAVHFMNAPYIYGVTDEQCTVYENCVIDQSAYTITYGETGKSYSSYEYVEGSGWKYQTRSDGVDTSGDEKYGNINVKYLNPISLDGHNYLFLKLKTTTSDDHGYIKISSTDAHDGDIFSFDWSTNMDRVYSQILDFPTDITQVYITIGVSSGFHDDDNKASTGTMYVEQISFLKS